MLSKYPPMGWNSWDCYGTTVTEAIVRQNALYMAAHLHLSIADSGYRCDQAAEPI